MLTIHRMMRLYTDDEAIFPHVEQMHKNDSNKS